MPGPLMRDLTPDWLKPENASVLDSSGTQLLRWLAHQLGADDPQTAVMGMAGELPVGKAVGGLAETVGRKVGPAATKISTQILDRLAGPAGEEGGQLLGGPTSKALGRSMERRMAADAPEVLAPTGRAASASASGLVDASGRPLGGTAPAIQTSKTAATARPGMRLGGRAYETLADTAKVTPDPGRYALRAATEDRLGDLHQIGLQMPKTADWQGGAHEELLNAFGGNEEMAKRWLRLWGATSPNTSGVRNTQESVSALLHSLTKPDTPLTAASARTLSPMKITMAGSKVPNINNAIAGQPLSGDKVEAMAQFMLGQPRIPIDVHALYALGPGQRDPENILSKQIPGLRKMFNTAEGRVSTGANRNQLSETDIYKRYEAALRQTLQGFDSTRDANQIFAELWEGTRAHKGLAYQGGPVDHLRNVGLMETGAMLDPKRLRAALRQSGWTAAGIAGLMTAMGHTDQASEAAQPNGSMRDRTFNALEATP